MGAHVFLLSIALLICGVMCESIPSGASYKDRTTLVSLNAVRMDPTNFKKIYMNGYSPSVSSILGTSVFPPVAPLYWNNNLGSSAASHSEDMAQNCGLQHASCDGTGTFTRIAQFYTCSGSKGENIAAGRSSPLSTVNQFLCDMSGSTCCPDSDSSCNGHRANIMSSRYKTVGLAYAYNAASTYKHYWTQDFGSCISSNTSASPVYSGSHLITTSTNKIKFVASYYTANNTAPKLAQVYINMTAQALTLDLGTASMGLYGFEQNVTSAAYCRRYFFKFTDATGKAWRYPESGMYTTTGEGNCASDWVDDNSDSDSGGTKSSAVSVTAYGAGLLFSLLVAAAYLL